MPIQTVSAPTIKPPGSGDVLVFSTLVLCAAFGDVSTGLFVPAMPSLGKIYHRPPETIQFTIASFAMMFAMGQLFFGPFSDRRGRRTALLLGAGLTLAGSAIAGLADTIWMIIVGRAIQGLGAGSGYVVARAIVRDIYGPEGSAKAMASLFGLMVASFMTATLVGGALLELATWRAGFVFTAAAAAIWLASTILIMPETRPPAAGTTTQAIHRTYLGLFRDRGFLSFMLTHSIAYAGLYCFVAGAPYFFIQSMGVKPASYGMLAAAVMSGFLIGSMVSRYASPRWGMQRVILASLVIMFGASASLLCLASLGSSPASVIVAMEIAWWFGAGFMAPNTAAGVMMSHPKAAGAAAAVLGFVQMCAAAVVSVMQGLIYDGTVFPMVGMQAVLSFATLVIWNWLSRPAP